VCYEILPGLPCSVSLRIVNEDCDGRYSVVVRSPTDFAGSRIQLIPSSSSFSNV
jgi:hypothetical protein